MIARNDRVKPSKQTPTPPEKPGLRARARAALFPGLLIVAALAAYHNSFNGPFIFDDIRAIPENPRIRALWPLSEVVASPPGLTLGGRPVVSVTLALNYALGGLDVRGYHAVNLGTHLLSTLVLYGIVRRTLRRPQLSDRYGERAEAIAFATALLWTVHPLLSESVDYVVQRGELLMGLFYLSTLYCFIRSLDSPRPRTWYVAGWIAGALALGSKEVAASLPLAVLLYDWLFVPGPRRKRLLVHAGLWAVALVGGIAVAQARAGAFPEGGLTSWQYLKTQAGVIAHYLRLSFWPSPLVVDYYGWPPAESLTAVLLPGLLIVTLIAVTVWSLRQRSGLAFLGAIFFMVLAPTSSVIPLSNEIAAERRMYLPLAAIVTLVVLATDEALGALARRARSPRLVRAVGLAILVAVALLLGAATVRRNAEYRTAISIWTDAVTKRPNNARGHTNLGFAFDEAGRPDEAVAAYEQALRVEPGFVTAQRNLMAARLRRGQPPEAEGQTRTPDFGETRINLSAMLIGQGRFEDALEQAREAVRIDPKNARAHHNLGVCLAHLRRWEEALAAHRESLALDPTQSETHNDLGVALASLGRIPEALKHFERAVRLKPGNEKAVANRDRARTMIGGEPPR